MEELEVEIEDEPMEVKLWDITADSKTERIKAIVKVPEPGEEYHGRVVGIQPFGAFVELLPGKDGLLHISKLANERVEKVEDVLNIGDEVEVKVSEIDSQGRVNLIRNDIVYTRSAAPRGDKGGERRRPPRRESSRND